MKTVLIFAVGFLAGAFAAKTLLQNKYEQQAQEEIDSVKESYSKREKKLEKDEAHVEETLARQHTVDAPYQITQEEYGTLDGYSLTELYRYSDGTILEAVGIETMEPLSDYDIMESIGAEIYDQLDQTDATAIYVRNDARKSDYEIIIEEGSND